MGALSTSGSQLLFRKTGIGLCSICNEGWLKGAAKLLGLPSQRTKPTLRDTKEVIESSFCPRAPQCECCWFSSALGWPRS